MPRARCRVWRTAITPATTRSRAREGGQEYRLRHQAGGLRAGRGAADRGHAERQASSSSTLPGAVGGDGSDQRGEADDDQRPGGRLCRGLPEDVDQHRDGEDRPAAAERAQAEPDERARRRCDDQRHAGRSACPPAAACGTWRRCRRSRRSRPASARRRRAATRRPRRGSRRRSAPRPRRRGSRRAGRGSSWIGMLTRPFDPGGAYSSLRRTSSTVTSRWWRTWARSAKVASGTPRAAAGAGPVLGLAGGVRCRPVDADPDQLTLGLGHVLGRLAEQGEGGAPFD